MQTPAIHPLAPEHLPSYVVAADGSDFLFHFMVFFTIGTIVLIGVLYLTLHAMPERMAHESNHSQMQVVGILALLALFTHNNVFWVIAILVAAFKVPDFITPVTSIAQSLSTMAARGGMPAHSAPVSEPEPDPQSGAVSQDAATVADAADAAAEDKEH